MKHKYEVLLEEYKIISNQIIHWDKQYWIKSNFFLAIESLFLSGISIFLLKGEINIELPIITILISLIVFNILICLIWRLSCLRTKEYLNLRFRRSKKIEKKLGHIRLIKIHDREKFLPKHNSSGQQESL
ncbi:RipA family octameric membrane protein, partial [Leptospira bandrabouensis]|uniref:RipA family octameric membrane protein n=1 Tax=Leptospira bandrabouensis TaxID=2484903 RepID=UPI001EE899B1